MWTYGIAMASLKKKEKKRNMSSAFYMAIWENHSLLWKRWTIAIIHQILASKKSVVPVNGCPEPWITCKRKLRQGDGDPMSPYLFVPTADTLTSIYLRASKWQSCIRLKTTPHVVPSVARLEGDLFFFQMGWKSSFSWRNNTIGARVHILFDWHNKLTMDAWDWGAARLRFFLFPIMPGRVR
jgi:hypothetical protein